MLGDEIWVDFEIPEFTAICPFSDFPDFAVIRLKYVPNERCIELKSLKMYINAFRNIKIFHEHVINIIMEDFVKACDPLKVRDRRRFSRPGKYQDDRPVKLYNEAYESPVSTNDGRRHNFGCDRRCFLHAVSTSFSISARTSPRP